MAARSQVHGSVVPLRLSLDEPLLDVERAAELLNVRVSWIREATRTGYLPCLKIGKHVRYTRSMLESWLADQRTGGPRNLKRRSA
jgi:excisionase family DNA binding protein